MLLFSSWVTLAILAGLASNAFNFISRYLLKDQEDSTAYAWFFEFVRFLFFIIVAITFDWKVIFTEQSIILFLLLGLTEWISVYWYMKMHEHAHLSISAILSRTRLIWIPIIAFFLIQERLHLSEYAGIAILFFGLSIVLSPKKFFIDKGATYANLSAFMIALNTVITKMALPYGSNSIVNAAITGIPALFFPLTMKDSPIRMKKIFQKNLSLKLLAVGVNIVSVYLFTAALRIGDPGKVNALYQGMLVTSILAGIIFLKERTDIRKKLIGAAITIIGVIILSSS
jgi:drug/metabolite transporter (DMT)-like permease